MPRGVPNKKPDEKAEVSKRIPVRSAPGKAIEVTEFGYDFENIHIPKEVPPNVIALAFVESLGSTTRKDAILDHFDVSQGFINEYAMSQKKHRVRVRNGIVSYGSGEFVVPKVGPEVFLRILEERLKYDSDIIHYFKGPDTARRMLAIKGVMATLKELTGGE